MQINRCQPNGASFEAGNTPTITVNRASRVPLFYQIALQIEAAINDGTLGPGEKLTSESELASHLGISRPTMHHAYEYLVAKGLLTQQWGSGTHVRTS